jgi:hypothetical protein
VCERERAYGVCVEVMMGAGASQCIQHGLKLKKQKFKCM